MRPIRLLLAGPLPPPIGGSGLVFKKLAQHLSKKKSIELTLLNTRPQNHCITSKFKTAGIALRVLLIFTLKAERSDIVSFHASRRALLYFSPLIIVISLLLRKPTILRLFGGAFSDTYENSSIFTQKCFLFLSTQASALLVQTKFLVKHFNKIGLQNPIWFPNTTNPESHSTNNFVKTPNRIIYLGRLTTEKGLNDIIESSKSLNESITIDCYGPLEEDFNDEKLKIESNSKVRYKGIIQPDDVQNIIKKYDILTLPTYYPSEGYPGVILQAYSAGIPVVATNWMALPEIINSNCGILIPPKSPTHLADALNELSNNPQHYHELCRGARKMANRFKEKLIFAEFEKLAIDINSSITKNNTI